MVLVGATPATGPAVTAAEPPSVRAVDDLRPDPGRIAYIGDGPHRSVATIGPRGALTPLLPPGAAGNDCQASARGDDMVWVSDRSGTGEEVFRRTGDGPVTPVVQLDGGRLADPVLSPDRRWIAFVSWENDDGEGSRTSADRCDDSRGRFGGAQPSVWVVRTDGTGLREAVRNADWADWSPDGTEFVFTRDERAYRTTVAAGGAQVPVSYGQTPAARPVWEPAVPGGRNRIAYITRTGEDEQALATVPAAGRGETRADILAVGERYQYGRHGAAWKPDGKELVFLSGEPYLVDAGAEACGTCQGTPLFDPDDVVLYETENVGWFSPAGGEPVVLVSGKDPEDFNIESQRAAVPLDRLELRAAQGEESALADPAYAPDGRRAAFVRTTGRPDAPDTERILVGDELGLARAVPLRYEGMDEGEHQERPTWSPDGTRLAFARSAPPDPDVPDPAAEIVVVDISRGPQDGRLLHVVPERTRPGYVCYSDDRDPTWSPDGTKLAFSRWSYCEPRINAVPEEPLKGPAPGGAGIAIDDSSGGTSDGGGPPVDDGPPSDDGAGTSDGPVRFRDDTRDRHIWTAEAKPGGVQFDVSAAQCGSPDCAVVDVRPAYRPGTGSIAFVRQTSVPSEPGLRAAPVSGYEGPRMVLEVGDDGMRCRGLVPFGGACPLAVPPADGDGPGYDMPDNPAWSPDGHRLAVDVVVSGWDSVTDRRIRVVDPANGEGETLPGKLYNGQQQPTWKPSSDLRVHLTTHDSPLMLGDRGTVVLVVWNHGVADSPRTRVRVELPTGLDFVAPSDPEGACTTDPADARQLVCDADVLTSGTKVRIELPVQGAAPGAQTIAATAEGGLTDHQPQDNTDDLVVVVVVPDLAVTATATPPVMGIREHSTVEFTVRNDGTATAGNVRLTPTVPPGLTLVSGTECPATGCELGSIAPGAEKKVSLVYTAGNAFSGTIEGRVTATTRDINPGNDRASVDLTVVDPRMPDAAITVTATPSRIPTGDRSTVVYTVRNLGDAPAKSVLLTPVLPSGLTVVTATPACPATGCALGDLAPGATVTVTRVVTASNALRGSVAGTVTTAGPDTDPGNNSASAPLTVDERPPHPRRSADPSVSVTAGPRTAYSGGRITAEVSVRNGGPVTATGLTLKVVVPPGFRVVSVSRPPCSTVDGCGLENLAPGARTTVRLQLAADGALTGAITAAVTTTGSDSNPANNTSSAPLTVRQPVLRLDPELGPPGAVTRARGSSFPPGAAVRLRWSEGVTAASAPVVVRADGTFSAPVLVLVQDALGPRDLRATHDAVPVPLFREVRARYLVVPGVLQPSDFQWRR
ncbi:CARDB domain-containing protein [Streptomyces xantholiticus]|uniref:CARDB domain-containing protein n=1 Tax=Streptomyces xantholiticus TaxID=68285 RepID=A0ABV1UX51_9ACTN